MNETPRASFDAAVAEEQRRSQVQRDRFLADALQQERYGEARRQRRLRRTPITLVLAGALLGQRFLWDGFLPSILFVLGIALAVVGVRGLIRILFGEGARALRR